MNLEHLEDYLKDYPYLSLIKKWNLLHIQVEKNVSVEELITLLLILRNQRVAFSFYDMEYYSPSDPGAYFYYNIEKTDSSTLWGMSLGNHGWTGGTYEISEAVIIQQIGNLAQLNQGLAIRIEKVGFLSGKIKTEIENLKMEDTLLVIHSKKK